MAGALQQGRKGRHVVGAEDGINPRGIVKDGVLILLRQAAAHGDLHTWVVFFGFLEGA